MKAFLASCFKSFTSSTLLSNWPGVLPTENHPPSLPKFYGRHGSGGGGTQDSGTRSSQSRPPSGIFRNLSLDREFRIPRQAWVRRVHPLRSSRIRGISRRHSNPASVNLTWPARLKKVSGFPWRHTRCSSDSQSLGWDQSNEVIPGILPTPANPNFQQYDAYISVIGHRQISVASNHQLRILELLITSLRKGASLRNHSPEPFISLHPPILRLVSGNPCRYSMSESPTWLNPHRLKLVRGMPAKNCRAFPVNKRQPERHRSVKRRPESPFKTESLNCSHPVRLSLVRGRPVRG